MAPVREYLYFCPSKTRQHLYVCPGKRPPARAPSADVCPQWRRYLYVCASKARTSDVPGTRVPTYDPSARASARMRYQSVVAAAARAAPQVSVFVLSY